MPLSEEELRLLEQMERALVADDPKLASTLRGTTFRRQARRKLVLGAVVFLAGVATLMAGAVLQITVVGILGFVVMLVSSYFVLNSWRGQSSAAGSAPQPGHPEGVSLSVIQGGKSGRRGGKSRPKQHRSVMERFEERWRRRREGNDGL